MRNLWAEVAIHASVCGYLSRVSVREGLEESPREPAYNSERLLNEFSVNSWLIQNIHYKQTQKS